VVTDRLPKCVQTQDKKRIRDIWLTSSKAATPRVYDRFVLEYSAEFPKVPLGELPVGRAGFPRGSL